MGTVFRSERSFLVPFPGKVLHGGPEFIYGIRFNGLTFSLVTQFTCGGVLGNLSRANVQRGGIFVGHFSVWGRLLTGEIILHGGIFHKGKLSTWGGGFQEKNTEEGSGIFA